MKKLIVLVLSIAIMMSISVFAAPDGASLGDIPQTTETITIDATKDDIYDKGLVMQLDRIQTEGQNDYGTHGTVWSVFNNGTLYAFVHMIDNDIETPDPTKQTGEPWSTESVEVFIDAGNTGDVANVMQYRIDVTGWPSVYNQSGVANYGQEAVGDSFGYAAKLGSKEYWLEFAIDIPGAAEQGFQFGFMFQNNDRNTTGDGTQVILYTPSSLNSGSWTAELYDYAVVGEMIVEEVIEEAAAPAVEAPAAEVAATAPATAPVAAAQTSDSTVLYAAALIAMLGTALVVKKVRN
jgi:Domain of unknown function (DUF1083).